MNTTFQDYLKGKGHTQKTMSSCLVIMGVYTKWLNKENLEIEEVTYNDLLLYMKHCQRRKLAQRTIQLYIGMIKHYYDYLIEQGKIKVNPTTDIEVKGVKRKAVYYIFSTQELHGLYNSYPEHTLLQKRNKAILGLMVYQGIKTEELAKLEVKDIQLREGKIDIPGSRRSNHRSLSLESHQVLALYDYILQTRPELINQETGKSPTDRETQKLFIGAGGNSRHFANFTQRMIKDLKATNPRVENAQQIRASVIVKWLKMYNLREVQVMAGHKYISTTESYKQNDLDGLKEAINQYHPLG